MVNGVWLSNEIDERWERKAATCGLSVTGGVVEDGERWRIERELFVPGRFGERCCRIGLGVEEETSIPSVLVDKGLSDAVSFGCDVNSFADESISRK